MAESPIPIVIKKVRKRRNTFTIGTWKVAFADFMTALMAFFLAMWVLGLDQDTRSAIAGYFKDPLRNSKKHQGRKINNSTKPTSFKGGSIFLTEQEIAKEKDSLQKLQREVEQSLRNDDEKLANLVEIRTTEEGLIIEFLEGVGEAFFEVGSAQISPKAKQMFSRIGKALAKSNRKLVIDGHTDSRPYAPGSDIDNWDLSQQRANALFRFLCQSGVEEKNVLAIRGFADRRLKVPHDPFHASNRRVAILVPYNWKLRSVIRSPM